MLLRVTLVFLLVGSLTPFTSCQKQVAGSAASSQAAVDTGGSDNEPTVTILQLQLESDLRPAVAMMRSCYKQRLQDDPGLKGRVGIKIRVGPDQRVRQVSVMDSDFDGDFHQRCIVRPLRHTRFFKKDVANVELAFPIEFKPGT